MDKDRFIEWFDLNYYELAENYLEEKGLRQDFHEFCEEEYINTMVD